LASLPVHVLAAGVDRPRFEGRRIGDVPVSSGVVFRKLTRLCTHFFPVNSLRPVFLLHQIAKRRLAMD
jgi:hypothetical protein